MQKRKSQSSHEIFFYLSHQYHLRLSDDFDGSFSIALVVIFKDLCWHSPVLQMTEVLQIKFSGVLR